LDDDHDDIHSPAAKVARLSSPVDVFNADSILVEEVAADGFDSDFENEYPDGVPCASTIINLLHDNYVRCTEIIK
jgi:hypothetical protein